MDSNERLIYVDIDEKDFIIRYKDIPDFIVDYNDKFGQTDLKFYDYGLGFLSPIITTFGSFLNYCDSQVRKDIIDRLVYLQQGGKIHNYKVTDSKSIQLLVDSLEFNNIKI